MIICKDFTLQWDCIIVSHRYGLVNGLIILIKKLEQEGLISMNNFIEHKGYVGTVEYSSEDNILFGQVIGIRGLISYEGNSIEELKADFAVAINDYLIECEANGREPQQPYNGQLNVRISPDIHKKLQMYSSSKSQILDEIVEAAIKSYIVAV